MKLFNCDCVRYISTDIEENTIDSIVTDPPYGINFMDKDWDKDSVVFVPEFWRKCYKILKPGGYMAIFAGTRTYHKIAYAIERAGFNIRDCISWLYLSGMPHGQNIGKAIEAKLTLGGANTQKFKELDGEKGISSLGYNKLHKIQDSRPSNYNDKECNININYYTKEGEYYSDYNTQLKPAHELICLAQKPPSEPTFAENVLRWGVGGLNIGACRIAHSEKVKTTKRKSRSDDIVFSKRSCGFDNTKNSIASADIRGRYPTNFIVDEDAIEKDLSKYFYCPKASKKEKGEGNTHATVKPIALMEYLVKLITPVDGTVLDPFMGSGTTGIAAYRNGFDFIGIEKEKEYFTIAVKRIYGD